MAITRAQQVRQMLEEGGRIEFRRGGIDRGFSAPTKQGQSPRGFAKTDREASENRVAAATNVKSMQQALGTKGSITEKQKEARDRLRNQRQGAQETIKQQREDAVIGRGPYELEDKDLSFVERANRFGAQKFTNLRKNTLRNLIDYIASGRKFKIPASSIYTDLTGKGLNMNVEDYQGLENVSPAQLQAMFGQDIIGTADEEKIRDISKVLGQDVITQSEFEQFYPNMNVPDDKGGPDQQETDPCKGPNPPAYCFVGGNVPPPSNNNQDPTGGLAFRFMSRGGSPMDAPTEGGIMDLETGRQMYFLGKLVKKATRAVKKIAKSPIGKAALLYGAGSLGASFLGQAKAGTGLGGLIKGKLLGVAGAAGTPGIGSKAGLLKDLGLIKGGFGTFGGLTGKGMFGLGGSILALLPFLSEDEQEQLISSRGKSFNIGETRDNPYTFASQVGSGSGIARAFSADGGRIGLEDGTNEDFQKYLKEREMFEKQKSLEQLFREFQEDLRRQKVAEQKQMAADGGRIGYQEGSKEPVAKKTMPLLDLDGQEMDLRDDGGFVPIGRMEKADDVPARLSKNEFVFTADAVRNAGGGDVDKGAEVMYNMMKNLESGGEVSEESQGLEGAREMFQTSKRLEEVL
jgi:hypothetical protein